jgi:hypothetical protein
MIRLGRMDQSDIPTLYTIYKHPRDFPNKYVVRMFKLDMPTPNRWNVDSLDEARAVVADLLPGGVCFPRDDSDDSVIVETWM